MNSTGKRGFPVMVWIHGGGFTFGDGVTNYGPRYFMDEDVILVTFNYRLGVFGFLSTGDEVIPGNNGLKDQVLALRWVQTNIKAFNGDPFKVLIYGESAGGASVHFQMLTPLSNGLFSRAIAQSGSALSFWSYQGNPRENAVGIATHLNCPTTAGDSSQITSEEIRDCLKAKTAEELNEAQFTFKATWPSNLRAFIFVPVTEPVPSATSTNVPFLTETAMSLVAQGKYGSEVPFMIGATEDEGATMYAGTVLSNEEWRKELDEEWDRIAPKAVGYDVHFTPEQQKAVSDGLRQLYFGTNAIGQETAQELVDFYSDHILHGVHKAALGYAAGGKNRRTYLYQYAHRGPLSIMGLELKVHSELAKKVGHADELQQQFDVALFGGAELLPPDSAHETFSKNFVRLWTSFAYEGEPKHSWGAHSLRKWKAISRKEVDGTSPLRWYRLEENPSFIDDPYKERMTALDTILADYFAPTSAQEKASETTKTEL
ncbi:Esterase FE4 [Orchesella cincta]|uniref:Esterase FE4 n=1 Tax=Orchesella cincta TaxID=48709 RepID=A0A1D2MVA2_ORCCI|nr:Esterase FE4 [Orchesella cincta]